MRKLAADRPAELEEPRQHDVARLPAAAGHELGRSQRVSGSARTFRGALVLLDYPNQPFVVTLPKGSTVFGNPRAEASATPARPGRAVLRGLPQPAQPAQPRAHAPRVLDGGLGRALRRGADGVRPLHHAGQGPRVRHGDPARRRLPGRRHLRPQEAVTDDFGPPDPALPNWSPTRYVEWTSWASGSSIWPNAGGGSSTQAESSGQAMFAHELSHILGIAETTTTCSACRRSAPTRASGRCSAVAASTGRAALTAAGRSRRPGARR